MRNIASNLKSKPSLWTCVIAFNDGDTDDCVQFTDLCLLKMDTNEPATEECVFIFNNRKSKKGTQSSVSPSSNAMAHVPVYTAVITPG